MDQRGEAISKEAEKLQKRAAAKKGQREKVDQAMVNTFLRAQETMPAEIRDNMLDQLSSGAFSQATMEEIRRRLAERDE